MDSAGGRFQIRSWKSLVKKENGTSSGCAIIDEERENVGRSKK
jgi:hypothetical protein